jgi:hypothetical protein
MSVTPSSELAGILPVVISGNRPALKPRKTARFLESLRGVTADPVWLVRDDRADEYERDGFEVVSFPREAAEEYAAGHWIGDEPYAAGSFLGCFTEREWAVRTAEDRGYWAVLQLDDNLSRLGCFFGGQPGVEVARRRGGLGFYADILAAVTLATNSRMTGATLDAVHPGAQTGLFARAGFPYSLFLERTGAGRPPYYGPIEEDILHAYEYGSGADPATAALVLPLHYRKDHGSQDTGMRPHYRDHKRTVGIQRVAPDMARIGVRRTHSNGRGAPRVFHTLRPWAWTPLAVLDEPLYFAAADVMKEVAAEVLTEHRANCAAKVARRAERAG